MKRILRTLAIVAVLLASAVPLVAEHTDTSSAAYGDGFLITELDPFGEGFTIRNTSGASMDLKGWCVSDGEGKVTFKASIVLGPGESKTFVSEDGSGALASRDGAVRYSKTASDAVMTKNFAFGNTSDELSLFSPGGALADAVCYGKSKGTEGWSGDPVGIGSGRYLLRTSVVDTDTAADWSSVKPGWSNNSFDPEIRYAADVTPFVFPDSKGIPVLDALRSAESTIFISIYLMSSADVSALLMEKARSGVTVRIMVDGGLLNGESALAPEYALLKHVDGAGAEVFVINDGAHSRYSYVHNKYAVIDGETTVITSENWTSGNIGGKGNRGWGAVIESGQYADFMTSVFRNDCTAEYGDVVPLADVTDISKYNTSVPVARDLGTFETRTYRASVTPVLSPDSSWDAVEWFISGASDYLYVEQMDLNDKLSATTGDTTISWMAQAAERGVDVRFILDASQQDKKDHIAAVDAINASTGITAIAVDGRSGFDLIHNKGLVSGSLTWVGSVNWTTNSFMNNRESAVIIDSQDVADYFKGYFLEDFGVTLETVEKDGLRLKARISDTSEGTFVTLTAAGPAGYSYRWELGDGTVRETPTGTALFKAPVPGEYTAKVTLVGTDIADSIAYIVKDGASGGGDQSGSEPGEKPGETPGETPGEDPSEKPEERPGEAPVQGDSQGDGGDSWAIYLLLILSVLLGIAISILRGKRNSRRRGRDSRNASRRRR